jgi:hypothetical protein
MDDMPIDKQHAIYLLIAVGWTTLFSMTSKQPIRGLRNLGILACYVLAIVMLIRAPFVSAVATWCAFGIAAGVIYSLYQIVAYARDKSPDKNLGLSFSHFIYGPLAWPIMIPEAIEYLLAELGVLRVQPVTPPTKTDAPPTA